MNILKSFLVLTAATLMIASPVRAAVSPHETITATIDGNDLKIVYGRPYSKTPGGTEIRKIWGTLVPWGQAWRLGADEVTTLTTAKAITLGGLAVPAGSYALYLVPSEKGVTKLAIGKKIGSWGVPVDEANDLGRVDMKKESIEKQVDQLTLAIEKNAAGGGTLKITWEKTQYTVAFTVKK